MKKLLLGLLCLASLSPTANAINERRALRVQTVNGSTANNIPIILQFPNGSLTDSGNGTMVVKLSSSDFNTGATAGSVLFAGSTGLISQDNSNFFWDSTNHRLGLGITTPGSPLSFGSTTEEKGRIFDDGVAADAAGFGDASGHLDFFCPTSANFYWRFGGSAGNPYMGLDPGGHLAIGLNQTFDAYLALPPGLATAGNGALSLSSGTILSVKSNGKFEYDSTHLYFTLGGTRYQLENQTGAITSVSNSDGTLTISPTTGLVVASIALGHANTWTATQTITTPTGAANTAGANGITSTGGNGGSSNGGAAGGNGGGDSFTMGTGGTASGSQVGGNGGPFTRTFGNGGAGVGTAGAHAGNGSGPTDVLGNGGTGGTGSSASNGGQGGDDVTRGGNGGTAGSSSSNGTAGRGSGIFKNAGKGGIGASGGGLNPSNGAAGGPISIAGAPGGSAGANGGGNTNGATGGTGSSETFRTGDGGAGTAAGGSGVSGNGGDSGDWLGQTGRAAAAPAGGVAGTRGVLMLQPEGGNIGLGVPKANITARVMYSSGTTAANTAPAKFLGGGSLMTTPESGAREYANNHYLTNVSSTRFSLGGILFDHIADAGNSGTNETDLYLDSTTANTLNGNGDKILAEYGGTFVNSTSTKEIKVYFASTTIFDTGALTIAAGADSWGVHVLVQRESSTVVRCTVTATTTGGSTGAYATYTRITGLDFTAINLLKISGQAAGVGAATNDVLAKHGYIEFKPSA